MNKLSVIYAFAFLGGCASQNVAYVSPVDRLRLVSLADVEGYSQSVAVALQTNDREVIFEKAKNAVAYGLKDPTSAQFRNIRLIRYKDGAVVCGQVNGKNSYGGYVGFVDFVSSVSSSVILKNDSKYSEVNSAANAGIYVACSGNELYEGEEKSLNIRRQINNEFIKKNY